jgi:hypothetical protein
MLRTGINLGGGDVAAKYSGIVLLSMLAGSDPAAAGGDALPINLRGGGSAVSI